MPTVQEVLQDNHLKHFVAPEETPVCKLEIAEAFKNLTPKEKLYAHHMSEASWAGTYIVLEQASRESVQIFDFLLDFFNALFKKTQTLTNEQFSKILGVSESVVSNFVQFASVFLGNMGNYKSFGDSKIIPRVEKEDIGKMVQNLGNASVALRFSKVKDVLYSLEKDELELGFAESAAQTTSSSYYSSNVTKQDAEFVQEFLKEKNISGINTRLFKSSNKEGQTTYELRIASAQKQLLGAHEYKGTKIVVTTGDFDYWLAKVRDHLALAKKYAANEIQEQMLDRYVKHFDEGDLQEHVESQKLWVKDIGPAVETNIGFIESYRDPLHVRAEWEGFVACVNKETSRKFNELVAGAEKFIDILPWNTAIEGSKPFEKDQFLRPDFTALEVLAFASSGIPAGINIPNYDDVRQNIGFKNVYLSNVVNAASPKEEITFLTAEDREIFTKLRGKAFEVQVGLHELLGHGSLKLLAEEKGSLNFDEKKVVNPITKQSVSTYYKTGETYYSKFSDISSSYEECRAEAVGIFLCVEDEILKIFGHSGQDGADIFYVNWLIMVRAGLLGLEFYSPESKKWLQAHMQARYVILKVLLEAGEGLVSLKQVGTDDLLLTLDRQKIKTVGIKAMSDFLLKLGVYKSTGDVESARAMYNKYSEVSEEFLKYRSIVLSKKKPRRVFVQPRTEIDLSGQVQLVEYEPSPVGVIQSFLARFPVV